MKISNIINAIFSPSLFFRQKRRVSDGLKYGFTDFYKIISIYISDDSVKYLWNYLAECAIVLNLNPRHDDDLFYIYGIDVLDLIDDVIYEILKIENVNFSKIDFSGFDFYKINTPVALAKFVQSVRKFSVCGGSFSEENLIL